MNADSNTPLFKDKTGRTFGGVTIGTLSIIRSKLISEFSLTESEIVEASSYSFAMVVRFALGLSALEGQVGVLVGDCLGGKVALACARHLLNGGALVRVFLPASSESIGSETKRALKYLERVGVDITYGITPEELKTALPTFHNVLCGLFSGMESANEFAKIVDVLNDAQTPIHAVEAPLGVNVDTGESLGTPLFASSTLSLGLPLSGLSIGSDYVGRHYLCDTSIPFEIYEDVKVPISSMFSEQPVQQIFPVQGA